MTLRCKPGDIAIVEFDDPPCLANVGQVVKVLGGLQPGVCSSAPSWLIQPLSGDYWYVCSWPIEVQARVYRSSDAQRIRIEHPDKYLRPIRETGFDAKVTEQRYRQKRQESIGLNDLASPQVSKEQVL